MQTIEEANALEKIADSNDGHCDRCGQTIKIYRYKVSRSHAVFLRAMAEAVSASGKNDTDIGTIGIAYSVRTQVTKIRQHGLIARVKNAAGAQIPRHWLITSKGWKFLNGEPIPSKVVVFNNQVLGHDGGMVNIYATLGEKRDPEAKQYEEAPVSPAEARTFSDVRQPTLAFSQRATFRGHSYGLTGVYKPGASYELVLERLQVGKPVKITAPHEREYPDIAAFQKDWIAK